MPNYHMNKAEREVTDKNEILKILKGGKYAVIALCRDNEPYVVTLSCGYDEDKNALYFHSASKGLKLDFISANPRACATIIEDKGYVDGHCEHHYSSLVMWGNISVIQDLDEKKRAMNVLIDHLESNPDPLKKRIFTNDTVYNNFTMLKLDITELTGKNGQ